MLRDQLRYFLMLLLVCFGLSINGEQTDQNKYKFDNFNNFDSFDGVAFLISMILIMLLLMIMKHAFLAGIENTKK